MKLRNGFVSNSSSSSFIVDLDRVSRQQERLIRETASDEDWQIEDNRDKLRMSTSMDNFDMLEFMLGIGVPREAIQGPWEFLPYDHDDEDDDRDMETL